VAFFQAFREALALPPRTAEAVRSRVERRYGIALQEFDLPRHLADVTTPALVIHDRRDGEVPWSDGAAIAGAWPGARLVSTDGLGHRRLLRDVEVVDEAVRFVTGRMRCSSCDRYAVEGHGDEARCASCALAAELASAPERRARPDPFAPSQLVLGRASTERILQRISSGRLEAGGGKA
jgi:hypothetical protein